MWPYYLAIAVAVLACIYALLEKSRRDGDWKKKVEAEARERQEKGHGEYLRIRLEDINQGGKFVIETFWAAGAGYSLLISNTQFSPFGNNPILKITMNCLKHSERQLSVSKRGEEGVKHLYSLSSEDIEKALKEAFIFMAEYPRS